MLIRPNNEDTIYFARRNVNTLENVLGASYAFNNKAGMTSQDATLLVGCRK